jgi:Ni/Fe-hydrogenase subunit HybB-like protein
VIVAAYLFTMMERRAGEYARPMGMLAFVWRLVLTTGTGSIFGFLVARQAFDTALLAPMFIIMSFAFGLAIYLLVLMFAFEQDGRALGDVVVNRLKNLLGVFILAVLLFSVIYHITKLYGAKYLGVESYFLLRGGIYSLVFWLGHVLIGCLIPFGIIHHPALSRSRTWLAAACGLVILGGLAIMYVVIIGSEAYPLEMFPGMIVLDEGLGGAAAGIAPYTPSLPEVLLGLGGVAVALLATAVGIRVLKFLPESLADEVVAEGH